jgi:Zn-dependent protease with chaperone function
LTLIFKAINLLIISLMTIILLLSIPFVVSKLTNRPVYTHPSFVKYLEDFEKDADKYNINLNLYKAVTIFSVSMEDGTAGFCIPNSKMVVISAKVWEGLDKPARKALLYHEWGHCILRRDHTEDYAYGSFCPTSLMYPYLDPLKYCYKNNQESYNRELFTNPFNFKTFSRSRK